MATNRGSGKTMSSRLLNMKFMQRSAPNTPPQTSTERQSKRRKTESSSTPDTPGLDWEAARLAREAEEEQRSKALERHVSNYAETKWTLDATKFFIPETRDASPIFVNVGYGAIDGRNKPVRSEASEGASSDEDVDEPLAGRQSFGDFKSKKKGTTMTKSAVEDEHDTSQDDDSDSSAGDDSHLSDAENGNASKRQRKQQDGSRKRQKRGESGTSTPSKPPTTPKEVSLRGLTSISGRGGSSGGGSGRDKSKFTCHACGNAGHFKKDCPNLRSRRPRA